MVQVAIKQNYPLYLLSILHKALKELNHSKVQ